MSDDIESWQHYHRETNPDVHRLALALHRVDEMISKQRDSNVKLQLQQIYNDKLVPFGRNPVGESEALLKKLKKELADIGTQAQTGAAVKSIEMDSSKALKFIDSKKSSPTCQS